MKTTKSKATEIYGFYSKTEKGAKLTRVATSQKEAKHLESHGWIKGSF